MSPEMCSCVSRQNPTYAAAYMKYKQHGRIVEPRPAICPNRLAQSLNHRPTKSLKNKKSLEDGPQCGRNAAADISECPGSSSSSALTRDACFTFWS
mmetsp:Transcript_150311/g.277221  ORF Transcript_150311/g.277221 Transcript_150311/m.277221 type:complete len:96 (+) Transcript_150311:424-711(+)